MRRIRQTGFTLIETLFLLLLLGIVAAVAVLVYGHRATSSPRGQPDAPAKTASAAAMTGAAIGIDTPPSNDSNAITEIGRTPAIIDDFVDWQDKGAPVSFPADFVDSVIARQSMPMITWQPNQSIAGNKSGSVLAAIINGSQDTYIRSWATAAKAAHHTIYLRLMHEMNGPWYPWGYGINGNTPALYLAAFRHVVDIFQQQQVSNVQFVWCVATSTANSANSKVNSDFTSYFPGDNYIAWTAMDGYSRSPRQPKTFAGIFGKTYGILTSLSKRPVMIAETATVENPSNPQAKADWITASFLSTLPQQFPKVKAVLYFDSKGNGYSYPIDTSPATLAAIRKVFSDHYFQAPAPSATLSY